MKLITLGKGMREARRAQAEKEDWLARSLAAKEGWSASENCLDDLLGIVFDLLSARGRLPAVSPIAAIASPAVLAVE